MPVPSTGAPLRRGPASVDPNPWVVRPPLAHSNRSTADSVLHDRIGARLEPGGLVTCTASLSSVTRAAAASRVPTPRIDPSRRSARPPAPANSLVTSIPRTGMTTRAPLCRTRRRSLRGPWGPTPEKRAAAGRLFARRVQSGGFERRMGGRWRRSIRADPIQLGRRGRSDRPGPARRLRPGPAERECSDEHYPACSLRAPGRVNSLVDDLIAGELRPPHPHRGTMTTATSS